MDKNQPRTTSLSPEVLEMVHEFCKPFREQYEAVADTLISLTGQYPIALCALYGSMLKGVRPSSDIDILVLVRDDYKEFGTLLDIDYNLSEAIDRNSVNQIKVDLKVRSVSGFLDVSRGTEFKRSFVENNLVFWEDGVSIDRRFIKKLKQFKLYT